MLTLAGKLTGAAWGGITLLADDELIDHFTFGISEESATELARAPWFVPLMHLIQKKATLTSLQDVIESGVLFSAPDAVGQAFQGDPGNLTCASGSRRRGSGTRITAGRFVPRCAAHLSRLLPGALYLTRTPEQPPFAAQDEMALMSIGSCVEQLGLFDETHLLTRLRLINRVAQVAAGSLELERILKFALHELDRHLPLQVGAIWLIDEEAHKRRGGKPRVQK